VHVRELLKPNDGPDTTLCDLLHNLQMRVTMSVYSILCCVVNGDSPYCAHMGYV